MSFRKMTALAGLALAFSQALAACESGGVSLGRDERASVERRRPPEHPVFDTSFGDEGVVNSCQNSGSGGSCNGAAPFRADTSFAPRPDGTIGLLRAGSLLSERLLPDGQLDPSFGDGGQSQLSGDDEIGWRVRSQPDGKLLVAGVSTAEPGVTRLYRATGEGELDATFGVGGVASFPGLPCALSLPLIAMQSERILVSGHCDSADGASSYAVAFRANADGSLDAGFGAPRGFVVYGNGGPLGRDGFNLGGLNALAVQRDGALVAVGSTQNVESPGRFVLRQTSDGAFDPTFGRGGLAALDFWPAAVSVAPSGKIVVVGNEPREGDDEEEAVNVPAIAVLLPDGTFDPSFGEGGRSRIELAGVEAEVFVTVLALSDGSALVAGKAGFDGQFALLMHVRADGTLDLGFGGDGVDDGAFLYDAARGTPGFNVGGNLTLVRQADGKILFGTDGMFVSAGGFLARLKTP